MSQYQSGYYNLKEVWLSNKVNAVKALMAKHAKFPPYTVRTYTSNVADAQKAGLKATKNPCTKHNFVAKIMTADRQVQYYTCKQDPKIYYSCSICGLCERNPKHTYQLSEKDKELLSGVHYFEANLATDQAYVGTNAAGEHIYWQSCIWCGMSSNYEQRHLASPI